MTTAESMRAAATEGARPRVLLCEETHFHRMLLSDIVAEAGCEAQWLPEGRSLVEAARSGRAAPDLVMLPLRPGDPQAAQGLATLRTLGGWGDVPVLAITTLAGSGFDPSALRTLGVIGAIDKTAIPEHVIFRINQVVRPYDSGRRNVRAPSFFPVDVECAGSSTTEYALNLSVAGMGLSSSRSIEPNTDITVRFWTPERSELIELSARVIHCQDSRRRYAPFELGVFFYPPAPAVAVRLENAVARLLQLAQESGVRVRTGPREQQRLG